MQGSSFVARAMGQPMPEWFSPGFRLRGLLLGLALDIEHAQLKFSGLCGVSIDFSKAFDRVPWEHVFELGKHAGLPEEILRPLRGMYASLRRHFRLGGMVGESFSSTNGILQGCPLSIILLNLLMQVWATAVESETPCRARCYADDAQASATLPAHIRMALAVTADFCRLTGMKMNLPKCHTWATEGDLRAELAQICVDDHVLECVCSDRFLGARMAYTRQSTGNRDTAKRRHEAEAVLARIDTIPLDLDANAKLVESTVNSKILYDTAVTPLSKKELQRWRSRICTAIWGRGNPARCMKLVFTLLCRGHATDPLQASVYRIISTVKRQLTRHPHLLGLWTEIVNGSLEVLDMPGVNINVHGPVMRFFWAAQKLGWEIVDSTTLRTRDGTNVPFLETDDGLLQHLIRDDLREYLWSEAARRRPDLQGLEQGIDREATMAFANSLRGRDKRLFMPFIVGALDTRQRKTSPETGTSPQLSLRRSLTN